MRVCTRCACIEKRNNDVDPSCKHSFNLLGFSRLHSPHTGCESNGDKTEDSLYLQGSLKRGYGQQCQVLLFLRVPHQVHVHQLFDLKHGNFSQGKDRTGKFLTIGAAYISQGQFHDLPTSIFLDTTFLTTAGNSSEASLPFATI